MNYNNCDVCNRSLDGLRITHARRLGTQQQMWLCPDCAKLRAAQDRKYAGVPDAEILRRIKERGPT